VLAVAGAQEMIDPISALAGIQAAVALIKKAAHYIDLLIELESKK